MFPPKSVVKLKALPVTWGGVGRGNQPSFLLLCVTTVCHAATVFITECAKKASQCSTQTIQILPSKNDAAENRHNKRFSKAVGCSLSLIWQKYSTVLARSEVLTGFCLQDAHSLPNRTASGNKVPTLA